jgi:hypothetical protein
MDKKRKVTAFLISLVIIIIVFIAGMYYFENNEFKKIDNLLDEKIDFRQKIKAYEEFEMKQFFLPSASKKYELKEKFNSIILQDIKKTIDINLKQIDQINLDTVALKQKKLDLIEIQRENIDVYSVYMNDNQELKNYIRKTDDNLSRLTQEIIISTENELTNLNNVDNLSENIEFYEQLELKYILDYSFNDELLKLAAYRLNDMKLLDQFGIEKKNIKGNIAIIKRGSIILTQLSTELNKEIFKNELLSLYEEAIDTELFNILKSKNIDSYNKFIKDYYDDFRNSVLFESIERIWITKNIKNQINNKIQPLFQQVILSKIAEYNSTLKYLIFQNLNTLLSQYQIDFPNNLEFRTYSMKINELLNENVPLILEVELDYEMDIENFEVSCNVNNSTYTKQTTGNSTSFTINCQLKEISEYIEIQVTNANKSVCEIMLEPPFKRKLEIEFEGKKLEIEIESNYSNLLIK